METTIKNGYTVYPGNRRDIIKKSIKEVEMIQSGKLPKRTARDFLKESRKR